AAGGVAGWDGVAAGRPQAARSTASPRSAALHRRTETRFRITGIANLPFRLSMVIFVPDPVNLRARARNGQPRPGTRAIYMMSDDGTNRTKVAMPRTARKRLKVIGRVASGRVHITIAPHSLNVRVSSIGTCERLV